MNEKKQSILDASLKLFVENGFHGTSTAEIAKTAGVATGTLFHYFKTKEELINSLYLHAKGGMLNEISGKYNDKISFKENIKSLWLKFIYFGINNAYMFQFILIFHSSPYITSLTKEQVENRFVELLEVYKKGIEKQEIKLVYSELVLDYFWGNVYSTVSHFGKYPEKLNEENIEMAFELFWDGISK
ncbi:MAG TPA: TetR/AcrR family transcriptional regulator [Methanobacterium sp.]